MEKSQDAPRERVERKAAIFERSVDLDHENAVTVAEDLLAAPTRKPSSDAVDRERNARAMAERDAEGER